MWDVGMKMRAGVWREADLERGPRVKTEVVLELRPAIPCETKVKYQERRYAAARHERHAHQGCSPWPRSIGKGTNESDNVVHYEELGYVAVDTKRPSPVEGVCYNLPSRTRGKPASALKLCWVH